MMPRSDTKLEHLLEAFVVDGSHRDVKIEENLVNALPALFSLRQLGWEFGLAQGGRCEKVELEALEQGLEADCSDGMRPGLIITKDQITGVVFVARGSTGSLEVDELDFDPREASPENMTLVLQLISTFALCLRRPLYLRFEGGDEVAASFRPDGSWTPHLEAIREFYDGWKTTRGDVGLASTLSTDSTKS